MPPSDSKGQQSFTLVEDPSRVCDTEALKRCFARYSGPDRDKFCRREIEEYRNKCAALAAAVRERKQRMQMEHLSERDRRRSGDLGQGALNAANDGDGGGGSCSDCERGLQEVRRMM